MDALAHHALLAAAVAAIAAAALRLASRIAPRGLERAIAAAPLGVGIAVLWALVLGIPELGTDRIALGLSALATWLAVRAVVPAPEVSLAADAGGWWSGLSRGARVAFGVVAALLAAHAVFLLRHPQLGADAVIYHLPDVVAWVENGRPASVVDLVYGRPVGNFPQANEVFLAWATGLSRSFVFAGVWSVLALALLAGAGWLGLRAVGADRRLAALGLLALGTAPIVLEEAARPGTDLPALAWLATTAALVVRSRGRPALLVPALVAAGLGIGTKPTVAPLTVLVLVVGVVMHRHRLRDHARGLALALGLACVVGGTYYFRNIVGHGAPLWPMSEFPAGDPQPAYFEAQAHSLLDRPDETLGGNLDQFEERLAGFLALFAAALVAPLVARTRAVLVASLATAASLLIYVNAPFTGAGDLESLIQPYLSALRYLMPATTAAIACLVLAAVHGGRAGRGLALAAFAVAIAWNLLHTLGLGYPVVPSAATVIVAAALGAVAAALAPARLAAWTPAAALAALVVVGAAATDGYAERHARANGASTRTPFAPIVGQIAARPDFRDGDEPVWMAPGVTPMLAGDTLDHDVELIPIDEPCPAIEARAREGWVVVADLVADSVPPFTARTCFEGREPVLEAGVYRAYRE